MKCEYLKRKASKEKKGETREMRREGIGSERD